MLSKVLQTSVPAILVNILLILIHPCCSELFVARSANLLAYNYDFLGNIFRHCKSCFNPTAAPTVDNTKNTTTKSCSVIVIIIDAIAVTSSIATF